MTPKTWLLVAGATLLGSTVPYTANAQYVICVNDLFGCQSQMKVSCAEIRADPTMKAHATQLCHQYGYSDGSAVQISGSKESGGECGQYKYRVACQR
jgi:hypothetical protein